MGGPGSRCLSADVRPRSQGPQMPSTAESKEAAQGGGLGMGDPGAGPRGPQGHTKDRACLRPGRVQGSILQTVKCSRSWTCSVPEGRSLRQDLVHLFARSFIQHVPPGPHWGPALCPMRGCSHDSDPTTPPRGPIEAGRRAKTKQGVTCRVDAAPGSQATKEGP